MNRVLLPTSGCSQYFGAFGRVTEVSQCDSTFGWTTCDINSSFWIVLLCLVESISEHQGATAAEVREYLATSVK